MYKEYEDYEFVIPQWAIVYLINSDNSGLSDQETDQVDRWVERINLDYNNPIIGMPEGEPYFSHYNDITGQAGNVYDITITVFER
jgi:hypothetical protein